MPSRQKSMLKEFLHNMLGTSSCQRRRSDQNRSYYYRPSIDDLEERRLLTVSVPVAESALMVAPLVNSTEVVGRHLFYNNSRYDGYNPAINATDDTAIATDKSPLLPSDERAVFANYSSYSAGINGVMVDIAGLSGTPTLNDFIFRVGNDNTPTNWGSAPTPASFSIRPNAGTGGSTRITIVWPDGSIRNEWLQITVRATSATGLAADDIFYFGNAVGDTGNSLVMAVSNSADRILVDANPRSASNPAPVTSAYDFNRDGLVDGTDDLVSRTAYVGNPNLLKLIGPGTFEWAEVVDRHVFYNNSVYDNKDAAANSADDGAIAPDKSALLPGQSATFANYTSYTNGINGVMIDIAGLINEPDLGDFEFLIGDNNASTKWEAAPAPSSISVRWGQGIGGSARVTLVWPDEAIKSEWLKVTVKSNAHTQLWRDDVFYFGNAIGETGDSTTDADVTYLDYSDTIQAQGSETDLATVYDFDRDGVVAAKDAYLVATHFSQPQLHLVDFTAPVAQSFTSVPAYVDLVSSDVINRGVFYNNSQYDALNPLVTSQDDSAIAPDKSALLPGQVATQANYTSYSRGLNGIFIDIEGAPADLTLADFEFRVGNLTNPSAWTLAPQPLQLLVRHGAGVDGSQRIMIVWQDNVIQNTWLQVKVKATTTTGLDHDDVFYFGNLIGDSGSNPTLPVVNAMDQIVTRNQNYDYQNTAPITHLGDFNRDKVVNAADEWESARNLGKYLVKLAAPELNTALEPTLPKDSFFHYGDSGVFVSFAPNLVTTNDGTVLYIGEARTGDADQTGYGLLIKRSFDNGDTWTPLSMIYQESNNAIRSPTVVVDKITGEIFLLFTRNDSEILVTSSQDDGATWSVPVNITSNVKVTNAGNPNPSSFPDTPWGWYAVGSGHGIQLEHGANAGRLIITADHRLTADNSGPSWSHIIYSDDHGLTWHLGGGLSQTSVNNYSNENTIVEQTDGTLYMNIRVVNSDYRAYSRSYDGGMTWQNMTYTGQLITSSVHASLLRVNENTILFSAPDSTNGGRQRMSIWMSQNNGLSWTKTKAVFYGYGSYSDMTLVGEDTVLLAFNSGRTEEEWRRYVTLVRFNLRWLTEPQTPQFTWQFAEKAPGERAEIGHAALIDDSIWDNRATALSSWYPDAPLYVDGPNGNTALRLTSGVDMVMLTPERTTSLQLERSDSITVEMTLRTTDTSGVIIGSRPGIRGWSILLEDGKVKFGVDDTSIASSVTSNVAINDGNWHRIVVIRNAASHKLTVIVDDVNIVIGDDATVTSLASADAITLGAYNDSSQQLAFDIDVLRVSRKALTSPDFMPSTLEEPPRWPAPDFGAYAPSNINGLQLWLPSYQPLLNYADLRFTDTLAEHPSIGAVVQSSRDVSANKFRVTANFQNTGVLYAEDPEVGPNWQFTPDSNVNAHAMIVGSSNSGSTTNFDFVQNTGEFTLSTFFKVEQYTSGMMAIFDNINASTTTNGFSLLAQSDGSIRLLVSGGEGNVRFNESTPSGLVSRGVWYHLAVVGNGPGQPVTYYLTPVSASTVNAYASTAFAGANGEYGSEQNLYIGGRTTNLSAFKGNMVDQAIYNRALSAAEIQQLFDYTKQSAL